MSAVDIPAIEGFDVKTFDIAIAPESGDVMDLFLSFKGDTDVLFIIVSMEFVPTTRKGRDDR